MTVRHTAANAEGVEIVANGDTSLGTFNNGEELGPVALPAGTISAEIKSGDTVVPPTPADVPVTEGENTIVYAWGDASGSLGNSGGGDVSPEGDPAVVVAVKGGQIGFPFHFGQGQRLVRQAMFRPGQEQVAGRVIQDVVLAG